MEKVFKINVPDGYEIDKEKSTFESIVFKKINDFVLKKIDDDAIKWNATTYAVEINVDGEHFMVDASRPSYCCSWDDAMRFHRNGIWNLPTIKQLEILFNYFENVNAIIRENGGYELIKRWYWSCEEKDVSCAWGVRIDYCNEFRTYKCGLYYVRAVAAL